jgi:hypothetical protein
MGYPNNLGLSRVTSAGWISDTDARHHPPRPGGEHVALLGNKASRCPPAHGQRGWAKAWAILA